VFDVRDRWLLCCRWDLFSAGFCGGDERPEEEEGEDGSIGDCGEFFDLDSVESGELLFE